MAHDHEADFKDAAYALCALNGLDPDGPEPGTEPATARERPLWRVFARRLLDYWPAFRGAG